MTISIRHNKTRSNQHTPPLGSLLGLLTFTTFVTLQVLTTQGKGSNKGFLHSFIQRIEFPYQVPIDPIELSEQDYNDIVYSITKDNVATKIKNVQLSEQELADIVRAVMTDTSILDGFRPLEDQATIAARNAERATKQKVELSEQELADIVRAVMTDTSILDGFRPLEDAGTIAARNAERATKQKVELTEQELADIVRAVMTDTSILDGFRPAENKATVEIRNQERITTKKTWFPSKIINKEEEKLEQWKQTCTTFSDENLTGFTVNCFKDRHSSIQFK